MGVILYKDMPRHLNEQIQGGCCCIRQGYPDPQCLDRRIEQLELHEKLELIVLKQLGWV